MRCFFSFCLITITWYDEMITFSLFLFLFCPFFFTQLEFFSWGTMEFGVFFVGDTNLAFFFP